MNNFLLYTSKEGAVNVDVLLKDETIWLTINQMAALFGIDKSGISRHIKNVFETGELEEEATVAKNATVQKEGNLDYRMVSLLWGVEKVWSLVGEGNKA